MTTETPATTIQPRFKVTVNKVKPEENLPVQTIKETLAAIKGDKEKYYWLAKICKKKLGIR